jgi:hypothetical protein
MFISKRRLSALGAKEDAEKASANIEKIFERKVAAAYALCQDEALRTSQDFQAHQAANQFWENRTNQAMDRMFTEPFKTEDAIGFIMAHGVEYGVYLELANNRKHQAIRPMILSRLSAFQGENGFRPALEKIFGAGE